MVTEFATSILKSVDSSLSNRFSLILPVYTMYCLNEVLLWMFSPMLLSTFSSLVGADNGLDFSVLGVDQLTDCCMPASTYWKLFHLTLSNSRNRKLNRTSNKCFLQLESLHGK